MLEVELPATFLWVCRNCYILLVIWGEFDGREDVSCLSVVLASASYWIVAVASVLASGLRL